MARKRHESHENHERWLVSYADFITLLFAFFVVMFATAQTNKSKAQQVSESVKKALDGDSFKSVVSVMLKEQRADPKAGNKGPGGISATGKSEEEKASGKIVDLLPSLQVLTQELDQEIREHKLEISMTSRGLVISFTQAALFPSGEDVIAKETYPSVQKIADAIQKIPNPVRLEGHTDAVPIHNSRFRSNWELSAARSIAVLELLTNFGVSRDQLSIAGYADTAPVSNDETAEGRQKNRRVDIIILNETGVKGEPERPGAPLAQNP